MGAKGSNFSFEDIKANHKLITNVDVDILVISKDKVKIILDQHRMALSSAGSWVGPGSLFLTFVITLVTVEFKDVWFTASVWHALFIVGAILAGVWFFKNIVQQFIYRKKRTAEFIIECMENQSRSGRGKSS